MHLLIVAQNLQTGGIQRALINMLEELSGNENLKIDLLVFGEGPLLEDVPKNVKLIRGKYLLNLTATPFAIVKSEGHVIKTLIRFILTVAVRILKSKRFYDYLFSLEDKLPMYDVAISYFNDVPNDYFNQGTNQYVDAYVEADKKIAWIHNDPIIASFDKNECEKKYKNFDVIVCVSEAVSKKFKEFLPEFADKVTTVYNFFPINKIKDMSSKENDITDEELTLVTVARIDNSQKRLDVVPKIVSRLVENNINNFTWTIVGEGPDLQSLKQQTKDLNVEQYLKIIGNKKNPYPIIKNSSIFILVSKFEGYPMVIGEALILGTPVVTTNFAAAKEQILHGTNGLIMNMDEDSIYFTLNEVLTNINLIDEMRGNIIREPYTNSIAQNQLTHILGL